VRCCFEVTLVGCAGHCSLEEPAGVASRFFGRECPSVLAGPETAAEPWAGHLETVLPSAAAAVVVGEPWLVAYPWRLEVSC